jgi:hypothetical protein
MKDGSAKFIENTLGFVQDRIDFTFQYKIPDNTSHNWDFG